MNYKNNYKEAFKSIEIYTREINNRLYNTKFT